jgi:hypothetical protein
MDQFAFNNKLKNRNSDCADLVPMAEHELAAFFGAVKKLFGSYQAGVSAEDWMHELLTADVLPTSAREWRLLTVRAITGLPVE